MGDVAAMLRRLALAISLVLVSGGAFAESQPADDHAGGGGGETASADRYIELDALTVTLFRGDAPAGALMVRVVVQIHQGADRAHLTGERLRLRDVMLRELHRLADREAQNGPKIDLDLVKRRLLKVSQRAMGPDMIDDVLVQALLRRGA
jgi:hypothetical protein